MNQLVGATLIVWIVFHHVGFTLTSPRCNFFGRPHPRGFCGEKLSRVHRNVCILLRIHHPELFQTSGSHEKKPLSASNGDHKQHKRRHRKHSRGTRKPRSVRNFLEMYEENIDQEEDWLSSVESAYGKGKNLDNQESRPAEGLQNWGAAVFQSDNTRKGRNLLRELIGGLGKRQATRILTPERLVRRKRDLVCECCYNQCTFSQVALYC